MSIGAILLSWAFRPDIIASLSIMTAVHLIGRWRLNRRNRGHPLSGWRTASYLTGIAVLAVALMGPVDTLVERVFFVHMIQHLLITGMAAPLLWLGDPFGVNLWGMPAFLRQLIGRWLRPGAAFRTALQAVTGPGIAWFAFVAFMVGWHDPNLYDLALEHQWVHNMEHVSMFAAAMLFWWHVVGSAPHIHKRLSLGVRAAYVLSMTLPDMLIGASLAFATRPIYPYYTTAQGLWGLSVMNDQALAGAFMWVGGGMMHSMAALVLFARMLGFGEAKTVAPSPSGRPPYSADRRSAGMG